MVNKDLYINPRRYRVRSRSPPSDRSIGRPAGHGRNRRRRSDDDAGHAAAAVVLVGRDDRFRGRRRRSSVRLSRSTASPSTAGRICRRLLGRRCRRRSSSRIAAARSASDGVPEQVGRRDQRRPDGGRRHRHRVRFYQSRTGGFQVEFPVCFVVTSRFVTGKPVTAHSLIEMLALPSGKLIPASSF